MALSQSVLRHNFLNNDVSHGTNTALQSVVDNPTLLRKAQEFADGLLKWAEANPDSTPREIMDQALDMLTASDVGTVSEVMAIKESIASNRDLQAFLDTDPEGEGATQPSDDPQSQESDAPTGSENEGAGAASGAASTGAQFVLPDHENAITPFDPTILGIANDDQEVASPSVSSDDGPTLSPEYLNARSSVAGVKFTNLVALYSSKYDKVFGWGAPFPGVWNEAGGFTIEKGKQFGLMKELGPVMLPLNTAAHGTTLGLQIYESIARSDDFDRMDTTQKWSFALGKTGIIGKSAVLFVYSGSNAINFFAPNSTFGNFWKSSIKSKAFFADSVSTVQQGATQYTAGAMAVLNLASVGANSASIHRLNENRANMSEFDYKYDMGTTATDLVTSILGFIGWGITALGATGVGAKAALILRAFTYAIMGINSIVKTVKKHFMPVEISGDSGDNTLKGNLKDNKMWGHEGNDDMKGGAGRDEMWGGPGNDRMDGGADMDFMWGGPGRDKMYGGPAGDVMSGGPDDDEVHGGPGRDHAMGDGGRDIVTGGTDDDLLEGGTEADRMAGGTGNDIMIGGGDSDIMHGGDGNDWMFGGQLQHQRLTSSFFSFLGPRENKTWDGQSFEVWREGSTPMQEFRAADSHFRLKSDGDIRMLEDSHADSPMQSEDTAQSKTTKAWLNARTAKNLIAIVDQDGELQFTYVKLSDWIGNSKIAQLLTKFFILEAEPGDEYFSWKEVYGGRTIEEIDADDLMSANADDSFKNGKTVLGLKIDSIKDVIDYSKNKFYDKMYGGAGNDVMVGTNSAMMDGGTGNDKILVGGPGKFQIYGGAGNDHVVLRYFNDTIETHARKMHSVEDNHALGFIDLPAELADPDDPDSYTLSLIVTQPQFQENLVRISLGDGHDLVAMMEHLHNPATENMLTNPFSTVLVDYGSDDADRGRRWIIDLGRGTAFDRDEFARHLGKQDIDTGNNTGISADISRHSDHHALTSGRTAAIQYEQPTSYKTAELAKIYGTTFKSHIVNGAEYHLPQAMPTGYEYDYFYGVQHVNGGDRDDIIRGTERAGTGNYRGDNIIYGGAGNDWIWGLSGNDYLHAGAGFDHLYGGAGNDILISGNGGGVFDGGEGIDTLSLQSGTGYQNTDIGGDRIFGYNIDLRSETVKINFGDPTDTFVQSLWGQGYNHRHIGTYTIRGIENVTGSRFGDRLYGDDGDNVLSGLGDNDHLYGGAGDDVLYGGAGNDHLYGGAGNDTFYATSGENKLFGGSGNDTFIIGQGTATIDDDSNAANGFDKLSYNHSLLIGGVERGVVIDITGGRTFYIPDQMPDTLDYDAMTVKDRFGNIEAFEGSIFDDWFDLGTLANGVAPGETKKLQLHGGTGIDTLDLSRLSARYTDVNMDMLTGLLRLSGRGIGTYEIQFSGFEKIIGSDARDEVTAAPGVTKIETGAGNDRIELVSGAVDIDGGSGRDLLSAAGYQYGVAIDIAGNGGQTFRPRFDREVTNQKLVKITGSNIETVNGSEFNDVIFAPEIGGTGNVRAGNGNDLVFGGDADNIFYGQRGDDHLYGGAGNDRLYGKAGNDELHGQRGDDHLYGGAGNDRLYGGAGDDELYGQRGDDHLYGKAGNDTLIGDAGDDRLYGKAGNDTLIGGAGKDVLTGGAGRDTFKIYDTATSLNDADLITDFSGHVQDGDKIDIGRVAGTVWIRRLDTDNNGTIDTVLYDNSAGNGGVYGILLDYDAALTSDDFVHHFSDGVVVSEIA